MRVACAVALTAAQQYPSVVFLKVDVDEVKAVASACGVRCVHAVFCQ